MHSVTTVTSKQTDLQDSQYNRHLVVSVESLTVDNKLNNYSACCGIYHSSITYYYIRSHLRPFYVWLVNICSPTMLL